MKPDVKVGMTNSMTHVVEEQHTTGHTSRSVLATPSMIGLVEWACLAVTQPYMEDEATVGIHVCVSHEAAVMLGESITIDVELAAIDGRKMTFDVEVTGPRGRVSTGTHQRAVIPLPGEGG
jgi:fluoroacetyl-CoA thioesterase